MKATLLAIALGCCFSAPSFAIPPAFPVHVVDPVVATQSSKEPVSFFSVVVFGTGDVATSDSNMFIIPTGKRLVLEHVSVDTAPTSCSFNLFTEITLRTGGHLIGHTMPVASSYAGSGGFQRNVMSTQVRLYGDPDTGVTLLLNRNDTSCSSVVSFVASGFLEDDL